MKSFKFGEIFKVNISCQLKVLNASSVFSPGIMAGNSPDISLVNYWEVTQSPAYIQLSASLYTLESLKYLRLLKVKKHF